MHRDYDYHRLLYYTETLESIINEIIAIIPN